MNVPLVSVCMVVYNGEKYIGESIQSILNQTYRSLELIIVNDGSRDSTAEIVSSFALKDDRIKFIENDENRGLSFTRNVALKASSGKYVAVNDSDDISEPNRLKKQVDFLEENEDYVAVGSCAIKFYQDGSEYFWYFPSTNEEARIWMFRGVPILNSSVMIKRKVLADNQIDYRKEYSSCEDFKQFAEISLHGKIGNIEIPLVKYRMHEGQQTKLQRHSMKKDAARVTLELLGDLGLEINQEEFLAFEKAFGYEYPFTKNQIVILSKFYGRCIQMNSIKGYFDKYRLASYISSKIYEVIFHSAKSANKNAIAELREIERITKVKYTPIEKFKVFLKQFI